MGYRDLHSEMFTFNSNATSIAIIHGKLSEKLIPSRSVFITPGAAKEDRYSQVCTVHPEVVNRNVIVVTEVDTQTVQGILDESGLKQGQDYTLFVFDYEKHRNAVWLVGPDSK